MNIHLAHHYGMCFGVRDALRATHDAARKAPITILGQLVHNPVVDQHLRTLGVKNGDLADPHSAATRDVVITAHGAADNQRESWKQAGYNITDTTCPLVRKAHAALSTLVESGYAPIVIGQATHAEVRGLTGDFPQAIVILSEADIARVPFHAKFGVISQTTQPVMRALALVDALKRQHPLAEVRFIDTVCHPTKQRQTAIEELCGRCDVVIVVGGRNSNNTRQLVETATRLGTRAHQVENASEVNEEWLHDASSVGVTAGTSTLDETVQAVIGRLQEIAPQSRSTNLVHAIKRAFQSPA